MSKTKARKVVRATKTTRPVKPTKAVKAVKAKAPKATTKAPHPNALKATKQTHSQRHHGKHLEDKNQEVTAAPEPIVVIKTVKWSAAELKQFRERLQRLHDTAVDDIGFLAGGHLANSEHGVADKSGGSSSDRTEDGTENFAQDLSLMQVSNKHDLLHKIIEAFHRLDQRTYGRCEQCAELIAEARLHAQPFATMCIKCQSATEANRPRSQGFRKSMVQMVESEAS